MNCRTRRGAAAVQFVVVLVPVVFGLVGFAVDLGILYSIKDELKAGANAMALAAAQQLNGTDAAATAAAAAAQLTIDNTGGSGNKYYFQGQPIGQTTGTMLSTASDPAFYATAADAISSGANGDSGVGAAQARHVRITVTGQTQLLFWSLLPIVSDRAVTVMASAVAGMSAPLCLACGIEPFTVAALNTADTTDFGFTAGTKYSMAYMCTGAPAPAVLPGATQTVNYLLLNRLDPNAAVFADEDSQAFRAGAGGLPGNTDTTQACFRISNTEVRWANASVNACSTRVASVVTDTLCGLDTRFESATPAACTAISGVDVLASVYQPDTDTSDHDLYTDYAGDGRRIITIPVVDTLSAAGSMTVLGFRQFLLIPNQGATNINPADANGRFIGMYIGSVAPVKQGRFDGCQQTAGPGKVVLHQ